MRSKPPGGLADSPEEDWNQERPQIRRIAIDLADMDEKESLWVSAKQVLISTRSVFQQLRVFVGLAIYEARQRKKAYVLGFLSVFLVVVLCVLLMSLITNLPVVFLRLGEKDQSRCDLVLQPGGQMVDAASLNYSAVRQVHPDSSPFGFHAPRITARSMRVVNSAECTKFDSVRDLWYHRSRDAVSAWEALPALSGSPAARNATGGGPVGMYLSADPCADGCVSEWCDLAVAPVVDVVAIDADREERMGFGADWPWRPAEGHAVMSESLAATMMVAAGDSVVVYGDVSYAMSEPFSRVSGSAASTTTIISLVIDEVVPEYKEKFSLQDYLVVDFATVVDLMGSGLSPSLAADDVSAFRATDSGECASTVHINVENKERLSIYANSDFNKIRRNMIHWVTQVVVPLGYSQLSVSAPLVDFLYKLRFVSIFVGLIMLILLLALAFLSVVLIFSLLNISVETHKYELGLKRMIGFTRGSVTVLVLIHAYLFAVPAWACALVAGQAMYFALGSVLQGLLDQRLPALVSGASVGWATLAAFLIPLAASVFPILSMLSVSLPEALNASRGQNPGAVYKITRAGDDTELNYTMFGLGFIFASCGFFLYYVFPLSLLLMNLSVMLLIILLLLVGMLAGLMLLSVNFERTLETAISYALLFWEHKAVFRLVHKLLAAHRLRNRKTTLMYAMTVGFVIFNTVDFDIQFTSLEFDLRRALGVEVVFTVTGMTLENMIPVFQLVNNRLGNMVAGVTFETRWMKYSFPWLDNHSLQTPGRYSFTDGQLVAVPPNFFDVVDSSFLRVSCYDDLVRDYGLSEALYTPEAQSKLIISKSSYDLLNMRDVSEPFVLVSAVRAQEGTGPVTQMRYAASSAAVLELAAVVSMGKVLGVGAYDFVASVPVSLRFSSEEYASALTMMVYRVYLHVPRKEHYAEVKGALHDLVAKNPNVYGSIRDIETDLSDLSTASQILNYFFIFSLVMALLLCFVSLFASMSTNVINSSKEIGILLCLGMSHSQIYRIFIWEALILVIAGGTLGVFVGILVGYTMQMQNTLFTQLPIPFHFPWTQMGIVAVSSLLAALLSSYSPVAYLLQLPTVTGILRHAS